MHSFLVVHRFRLDFDPISVLIAPKTQIRSLKNSDGYKDVKIVRQILSALILFYNLLIVHILADGERARSSGAPWQPCRLCGHYGGPGGVDGPSHLSGTQAKHLCSRSSRYRYAVMSANQTRPDELRCRL